MALDNNFKVGVIDAVNDLVSAEGVLFANALFESDYSIQDFKAKHTIITGIRNGKNVPIISRGNAYNSLSASTDDCNFNSCDLDTNYSLKKWIVGDYDCRVELCLKKYEENFWLFWNAFKPKLDDPLAKPDKYAFKSWLLSLSEDRIQGALWRTAYWGDTSTENKLINKNNGFWTNAEAGEGLKFDFDATQDGKELYNKFVQVYDEVINKPWFDLTSFRWKMSYALAQKFVGWLNTLGDLSPYNCACVNPDSIVASRRFSVEGLQILGIPVDTYREHDAALVQGLNGTTDYRALLVNPDNYLVGINTEESLNGFRMIYDPISDKVLIDLSIQIGTSIPKDEYAIIKFK